MCNYLFELNWTCWRLQKGHFTFWLHKQEHSIHTETENDHKSNFNCSTMLLISAHLLLDLKVNRVGTTTLNLGIAVITFNIFLLQGKNIHISCDVKLSIPFKTAVAFCA